MSDFDRELAGVAADVRALQGAISDIKKRADDFEKKVEPLFQLRIWLIVLVGVGAALGISGGVGLGLLEHRVSGIQENIKDVDKAAARAFEEAKKGAISDFDQHVQNRTAEHAKQLKGLNQRTTELESTRTKPLKFCQTIWPNHFGDIVVVPDHFKVEDCRDMFGKSAFEQSLAAEGIEFYVGCLNAAPPKIQRGPNKGVLPPGNSCGW